MTIFYTYLIGWKKQNKFYYGVRFAKNCHPDDLWTTYFTSSKVVQSFRKEYGEPDIIEIRKTFSCSSKARKWEEKVLKKLKIFETNKWLNKTTNISIHPDHCAKAMKDKKGAMHPAYGRKNTFLSEYNVKNNVNRNKKFSGSLHPFYGKKGVMHPAYGFSKITDERIKELQEIIICPHCSKIGKRGGMQRWHFDHCKSNKYSNKILKENQICFGEI